MAHQSEAATPAMETEASKTRSLDIPFLVDSEHLTRLESVLLEVGNALEYQVRFSDGHALQVHKVEDILKQPNSRTRSIVSLIAGVTGRGKHSAYMVLKDKPAQSPQPLFGDNAVTPSVEYTVNGTQRHVIYIGDKLDEWTAGIRQWYSPFYRGVPLLLLMAAVVAAPIWLWNNASPHLLSQAFVKAHDWLQGALLLGFWVGTYWLFKLFPRATFAIGQGVRRHQMVAFLRSSVVVGFALSLVASLLANWLISVH